VRPIVGGVRIVWIVAAAALLLVCLALAVTLPAAWAAASSLRGAAAAGQIVLERVALG
jgi:hypothetical protein